MRRIVITGCGGGLGEALMDEARDAGHTVFPHYRRSDDPNVLVGNLTDWSFVDKFNDYMQKNNVDTFINNAAQYVGGPIEKMSDHEIKHAVDTNVTAQILLMKTAFRRFKAMKGGLIVNINSLAYQQPSANETIYCATKFALKGFSKALQMEAIGTGVEIIDVHPGGIQTNMTRDRKGFETMMRPEDVAAWIIDTVDRDSGYINEIVLRKRNESRCS